VKLVDLRKLAIKQQQKIRFPLKNGMSCLMDQRGVALVPGLDRVSDFNLETELEAASSFVLEPVVPAGQKNPPKPRTLTREEMSALVTAAPAAAGHHDDHDHE